MSVLSCSGLSFRVRDAELLNDIDLEVQLGETLGIVGPNGSGKSTLLKLLAGLRTPATGEVRLGGQRLGTLSRRSIAQHQLDILQWLMGPIDEVYGVWRNLNHEFGKPPL